MRKIYVFVGMVFLSVSLSHAQYGVSGTAVNPSEDDKTDRNILDSLNNHYKIGDVIQIVRVAQATEVVKEEPPEEESKETPLKEVVKVEVLKEKKETPPEPIRAKGEAKRLSASQKSSSTGKKLSSAKSSSRKRVKRKKSWNRGRIKRTKRKRKMGRRATCPKF